VPPFNLEINQTLKQHSAEISLTPLSTPSLTNSSSLSSSNSSVSSKSHKSRRSDRSKNVANKSSGLSRSVHTYGNFGFLTQFDNNTEDSTFRGRSPVQSCGSVTDSCCSPEPGAPDSESNWSGSTFQPSAASYQSSLAPLMDETGGSSHWKTENAMELSQRSLMACSSHRAAFQGWSIHWNGPTQYQ
jgi:hypothetical protein